MRCIRTFGLIVLAAGLLSSCASYRYTRQAAEAVSTENWDSAVYYYLEALAADPANVKLKMELQRARSKAAEQHFRQGMRFRDADELYRARTEFELAVQLDPTHQYAEVELSKVRRDLEIAAQEGGMAKLEAMKKAASDMRVKPPMLNPASPEPLSLNFPNPTNVKDIYKAIGQAFGINILLDPKLKDNRITIELRDVTAREALETVMQAAGHFYKVLDEKTILVVEDTAQNRRDYEDLVVKTFFLSNADVKDVNNMLRALIDARRIAVNEQLNSIVIRDTADKVAIAERLINANDKAKAEVVVDVELIQVDSTKIRDIGAALSSYSFPVTMDPTSITGDSKNSRISLPSLKDITRSMWGVTVPNVTINLIKSASEAETLAQPQLRISEGEKGNLVIGDRVPIPTTTFNTSSTVGGNIVPITAFNYQDVGIKVEIEPRVHHNNEVTLKLKVEVSQLGDQVDIGNGQKQYKIGTRTIDSVIRLKDGETSLLAGLYKYSKTTSSAGIPFLSDIPGLGALFRSNSKNFLKTDLVLTLTPHIIRNPDITEEDLAPVWVGTENRITISGSSPRVQSPSTSSPFGDASSTNPNSPLYTPDETQQQPPEDGQQETAKPPDQPMNLVPTPGDEKRVVTPRPRAVPVPGPGLGASGAGANVTGAGEVAAAAVSEEGIARVMFYPARLPVVVGSEAAFTVVLDPGQEGTTGPLNFAYDPARLEVTRVEGGDLPGSGSSAAVQVTQSAPLGWISAAWNGPARGSGTLMRVWVRPRVAGELALIFAGPIGAVAAQPVTVVALPAVPAAAGSVQ